ncbi:zinc/iron permease [Tieghemostelium lacteum]|uniref:Zinc/iron permease n=1 Tax=Tieghemostelium lacteum TaxID=361077 RepID=A0A151ZKC4_TIELA|nr:zinc/iron permease [Tieghemostelium lacteum]|eukprot:KYQ94359.1 zinc/iron permease [Tieghemostelium lacteum]
MTQFDENVNLALSMTLISGLSTAIGGFYVLFMKKPSFGLLGHMLSFSSGVMLYISFMDLLPESVEEIGFLQANIWFFIGMLIFALVLKFIPEDHSHDLEHSHSHKESAKSTKTNTTTKDQEGTDDSTTVSDNAEKENKKKTTKTDSKSTENLKEDEHKDKKKHDDGYLKKLGIATAVGISLHNFPEGVAVYLASLKGVEVGLPLMLAIAAHNIPEGMAVAAPIYSATGSKWQAFKYCLYSGLCEPLGALIFGLIFREFMTPFLIQCMLAAVAGIMVLVVIKELLPASFKYIDADSAVISNVIGMIFIAASIHILHSMLPHGEHGHSHGGSSSSLPTKHLTLEGGSIDVSNINIIKNAQHGHSHSSGDHGHSHGGHGHSHHGHSH